MSAVPAGLRVNGWFRQPHAEARSWQPLRLRRGRRAAAGMKRFYTGPFEGLSSIKPPALPEDTWNYSCICFGTLQSGPKGPEIGA
jgi:hypothetical protein